MVACWNTARQPENATSIDDIPRNERDNNSWWYLHGELESLVGYDKAVVCNCKSGGFGKETIDWSEISGNEVLSVHSENTKMCMHINGIVDVEIEGIDKPCVGYFWTDREKSIYWKRKEYGFWNQRGLVCFKDDEESCAYADKLMREKPLIF